MVGGNGVGRLVSRWENAQRKPHSCDTVIMNFYDFMREVVGFDLAAFFQRNSSILREEIDAILRYLLVPESL